MQMFAKWPAVFAASNSVGAAISSARSRRNSCIMSRMRGTPCSVKAPETIGFFDVVSSM